MGIHALNKLCKNCNKVKINDDSKIVVVSDVHRGDGTYADSLIGNKNIYFAALSYYYNEGYILIEAGDGDELWKNKNYIDIAYNYDGIFKLLNKFNKEERLHLIYGNHDKQKSNPEYMDKQLKKMECMGEHFGQEFRELVNNVAFQEAVILNYQKNNKDILITHGHQVDFINYELYYISRFLVRYIWRFLESIAGCKAPTSPANSYKKGGKIDQKLEEYARKKRKMIICGHTHKSRFPEVGKGTYFNDGSCVMPYSMSSIEICHGMIMLVKWSMYVKEDRSLFINRKIIAGPNKLEHYLKYTL